MFFNLLIHLVSKSANITSNIYYKVQIWAKEIHNAMHDLKYFNPHQTGQRGQGWIAPAPEGSGYTRIKSDSLITLNTLISVLKISI
jgi:hypothetical protein